jgi:GT2 family glycosyltransferase
LSQSNKKLSVIFVNYNKRVFLKKSLKNLMGQVDLKGGDEVIVADGGSNDRSDKLIEKDFSPDVGFISTTHTPYNLNTVRNLGVARAKNDLIVIFDADVVPQPGCIDRLRAEAAQGRFIGGIIIYETDAEARVQFQKTHKGEMVPHHFLVGNFPMENVIKIVEAPNTEKTGTLGGIMCFSKKDWEHVGGFDSAYNGHWGFDETDFILKLHFSGVEVGVIKPVRTGDPRNNLGFIGVFGFHQHHSERRGWKLESRERNRKILASRLPAYREGRFK